MSRAKRNVAYTKPPEPEFLRKLKERVGYEEGPSIDTKKESLPLAPDEDNDRDDEKPTVVVLSKGDLTAEEAEEFMKEQEKNECSTGKLEFRQPTKRSCDDKQNPLQTSTKKTRNEGSAKLNLPERKKVKNSSLLSFVEEDE